MKNIELKKQIDELQRELEFNKENAAKALAAYEALLERGREREDRLKHALRTMASDLASFAGPEGDPDNDRAYDDAISKAQSIAGMVL